MVSHPEVNRRLREFVCVRLDWEQMQRHRARWPTPTQGNQVLLDPDGEYVPGTDPRGKRYAIADLVPLLDRILARFPPDPRRQSDLELSWFWWNPKRFGYPEHFGAEAISRLDRKPLVTVSGPLPPWLQRSDFLRRHLRQFIWTRGESGGAPRITIRQLEPRARLLAEIDPGSAGAEAAGRALDRAWLEFMKERPLTARGYIDNPHGAWLKPVMEGLHLEEQRVREEALKGTLLPPGRAPR